MTPVHVRIQAVLQQFLSEIMAKSILDYCVTTAEVDLNRLLPDDARRLFEELQKGVRIYIEDPRAKQRCIALISDVLS